MRKLLSALILIPLGIVIVMFAVANREIISVSFDPFDTVSPAFALKVPLYGLIFALVGLGVLVGGISSWLKQHKWRARARRAEAEARDLRARLDSIEPRRPMPVPRDTRTSLILPPAA
jgi:lipopolysaccharide assembly LapA-like protein